MKPAEYLNYLVTERWHDRDPISPKMYGEKKLGKNTKLDWPARSDWKINSADLPA